MSGLFPPFVKDDLECGRHDTVVGFYGNGLWFPLGVVLQLSMMWIGLDGWLFWLAWYWVTEFNVV